MTDRYDFIGCAKRMGAVLIGRTEPSVKAVTTTAHSFSEAADDHIGAALRSVYQDTVAEGVPADFAALLDLISVDTSVRASN